ncbi:MAG: putative CRISPR-associated protein [Desulfurococcales archaeon]|nr:putative CRISPR-associated protein [Desulfurococcales archaeon]
MAWPMPLAHIIIVGTSSLRNAANRSRLGSLFSSDEAARMEEVLRRCNVQGLCEDTGVIVDTVLRLVNADPWSMSAELNAMKPWLEAYLNGIKRSVSKAVLLETDTIQGRICGGVLGKHLAGMGISVERTTAPNLGVPGKFVEGLRSLLTMIKAKAEEANRNGYCPLINLTGGFKPETAIGLAASIGYIPLAYYIHETFKNTIYLPLYPLVNKRGALEELSKASDMVKLIEIPSPSEWLKCLASTLEPVGHAIFSKVDSILLHPDVVDVIKVLATYI